MYYCAALLVRQHHAADLYQGAANGSDPQKALAPPSSPLYQVATKQGLDFVGLYVYPPLLADLLIPYTFLSLPAATSLWLLTNGMFLLLTAVIVTRLLDLTLLSWQAALLSLALACFTPALQCLVDGQITIVLLLLWSAGMLLYKREHDAAAGVVFALAAAIKLTPAIVLLPLLLWRRWRTAGALLLTLLGCTAVSFAVDTVAATRTFALRVLPAMSGAIPTYSNFSLPCSVQRYLTLIRTGIVAAAPGTLPPGTVFAGRLSALMVTGALLALIYRRNRVSNDRRHQLMILALLSLMAPVLSPVSWFHAYVTAFLALAFLWRDGLRRPVSFGYLLTLTGVSLSFGSAVTENLIPLLLRSGYVVASSSLHLGQLLAAIGLVFYRINQIDLLPPTAHA